MVQTRSMTKGPRRSSRPSILLTTPEGLCLDTTTYSLSPLLSEPPPTPTEEDLTLDTFIEGHSLVIGPSDDEDSNDSSTSPFADPADYYYDESPPLEDFISYWSVSSSSDSSSDSDSDSDDDGMDFRYDQDRAVEILCTDDASGFTSFPPLPYPEDDGDGDGDGDGMAAFRSELACAEEARAYDSKDVTAAELMGAVEAVERDYARGGWSFTRPLPRWAYLTSSNSFPVLGLGPNDLRHGHSKLRYASSAAAEEDIGDWESSKLASRNNMTVEVAMGGVTFL